MTIQDTTKLAMAKGQALLVFTFVFGALLGGLVVISLPVEHRSAGSLATARNQCELGIVAPAP